MNYSFEIYKFDKDCFTFSTYLNIFFCCLLLGLQMYNCFIHTLVNIFVFSIIILLYFVCTIKKYGILQKIKKQVFHKIIIDSDNNITLYDYNGNITNISQQNIVSNKISKIGLGVFYIFPCSPYNTYLYNWCIVKLGDIEITTSSGKKYSIIISDIENFITNTIFQNINRTTIY